MSQVDAVTRVAQIQAQLAALQTAFTPQATTSATSTTTPTTATGTTGGSSFANVLAQASGTTATGGASATGGPALSAKAQSMLTTDQQQFASRLAADTGLSPQVVAAWLLAEESGGAAQSRQSAHNNDWLNIGYTDSGTYGSSDSIWGNPVTAADATAGWLKGQDTIPGYGRAAAGIQAIMQTAGQSPQAQMSAIENSGWASGGYPELAQLFAQVGG
jgi:hypothetical protein